MKLPRRPARPALGVSLLVLVLWLGAAGAYLLHTASQAGDALAASRPALQSAQQALRAGDLAGASAALRTAAPHVARARRLTSGPVWAVAARLPVVGGNPATLRAVTRTCDELVRGVGQPALRAVQLGAGSDTLELSRLRSTGLTLTAAAGRAQHSRNELAATPTLLVAGPLIRAREQLLHQLDDKLLPALHRSAAAASVAPDLLGASGPRRYFVALQNTAEARGTGGLLGVYAIVVAEAGKVRLERVGSDVDLVSRETAPVHLGEEYAFRYAEYAAGSDWLSGNLSPHFPYAARTWSTLWERQNRQKLDGVLGADPAVLDALLAASGPLPLPDGTVLGAGQAVAVTQQQAYVRYGTQTERKLFLAGLVGATFERLSSADLPTLPMLRSLSGAATAGRLQVYSATPAEQLLLARAGLAGELPRTSRPFLLTTVNNAFGNKLDYYLDQQVDYRLGSCNGDERPSTVTIRLTNRAPGGLSPYVTGAVEPTRTRPYPYAWHRVLLSVFTTSGSQLTAATLNGRPVALRPSTERGHPVYDTYVDLPVGQEAVLAL
ncbi:MAG: DUF4012 domain-containing protein, partial [Actinomycetota bacterium]|nr:DUF4012 domain-containing protein [Actinomycetota bacterium]